LRGETHPHPRPLSLEGRGEVEACAEWLVERLRAIVAEAGEPVRPKEVYALAPVAGAVYAPGRAYRPERGAGSGGGLVEGGERLPDAGGVGVFNGFEDGEGLGPKLAGASGVA
jgi:hypothetical protein